MQKVIIQIGLVYKDYFNFNCGNVGGALAKFYINTESIEARAYQEQQEIWIDGVSGKIPVLLSSYDTIPIEISSNYPILVDVSWGFSLVTDTEITNSFLRTDAYITNPVSVETEGSFGPVMMVGWKELDDYYVWQEKKKEVSGNSKGSLEKISENLKEKENFSCKGG